MALGEMSSFEERAHELRAGIRINSRVPVAVEWEKAGKVERAQGYTRDTSTKGCLAVIPEEFGIGQRLRVINLINQNACEAVLIWRGHFGSAGWELGLELQGAPLDFWGVDLY